MQEIVQELISSLGNIAIWCVATYAINSLKKLLKEVDFGEYIFQISFKKSDRQL